MRDQPLKEREACRSLSGESIAAHWRRGAEMRRLSLDHITAVDADPEALAEAAAAADCGGICLFMEPMDVLPHMPRFDLYGDAPRRRDLRRRMDDLGVALDLAYPFTLAGRTEVTAFDVALGGAAELGASLVNVLAYDRDPERRLDRFGAFCDLAEGFGLGVAVEFYPVSQVRSLGEALELTAAIGRPGHVGVNADLLHLLRSGGSIAELAAAPPGAVLYGQFCDGPAACPAERLDEEASSARRLAGEGVFDLAGFARALPPGCPVSVEIPRNAAIDAGEARAERVKRAVGGVRRVLGES
jgi:sugar phosphate isomerase/epimerase